VLNKRNFKGKNNGGVLNLHLPNGSLKIQNLKCFKKGSILSAYRSQSSLKLPISKKQKHRERSFMLPLPAFAPSK
jgi:hypothetical protein